MSELLSRRALIKTGIATAAGASGLVVAARLASRYGLVPPDHQGLYGAGESLTYSAQRILTSQHSLARESWRASCATGRAGRLKRLMDHRFPSRPRILLIFH